MANRNRKMIAVLLVLASVLGILFYMNSGNNITDTFPDAPWPSAPRPDETWK